MREWFRKFAKATSDMAGTPWVFFLAIVTIVVWALTGPLFHFSDTWQLVINTGTTIVTFLMVFLIQNTQNRDSISIHLKLDELIRATKNAKDSLIDLEDLPDKDLQGLQETFKEIREKKEGKDRAHASPQDEEKKA